MAAEKIREKRSDVGVVRVDVPDAFGQFVTPMSSLEISRNSRGYTYALKVYVADASEILDVDGGEVFKQILLFDERFKRVFTMAEKE